MLLLEKRADWGAGKRNFASIYLEPLTEADMRELLAGLVPGLPPIVPPLPLPSLPLPSLPLPPLLP